MTIPPPLFGRRQKRKLHKGEIRALHIEGGRSIRWTVPPDRARRWADDAAFEEIGNVWFVLLPGERIGPLPTLDKAVMTWRIARSAGAVHKNRGNGAA